MAGHIPENSTYEECEGIYLRNLRVAAEMLELASSFCVLVCYFSQISISYGTV